MLKKLSKRWIIYLILTVCLFITALLEFKFHRRFTFLWDDIWYSTNLVTGQPISSFSDIFEGQYWHYFNWGGRSINHAVLQLTIWGGELFADFLNLFVTCTLSLLICAFSDIKKYKYFCLSFFLLISLNTDINLSMFWQAGAANYLYPTNWVLLFLLLYAIYVKNPDLKKYKLLSVLMLPLGLITGWSNENMGPACAVSAFIVIIYYKWFLKRKTPLFMWIGALSSSLGSALLILAPGNFVRNTHNESLSFFETLYDRFYSMLAGGFSYLFPSLIFLCIFLLLYWRAGNKLQPYQIILMLTTLLGYGAMILSPTFPNRAAFGIMALCIVLIISFIQGMEDTDKSTSKYVVLFTLCMWISSVISLIAALRLPL